jgi:hypothetical protein
LTNKSAPGVRGARKSVLAMKAARTKRTLVKKPKIFWARVRVECISALESLSQDNGWGLAQWISCKAMTLARRSAENVALVERRRCVEIVD